jgi:hypothetical protein
MNRNKILLGILLVLLLFVVLSQYLAGRRYPATTIVSDKAERKISPPKDSDHRILLPEPEATQEEAPQGIPPGGIPDMTAAIPSPMPEIPPALSLEVLPSHPARAEAAMSPSSVSLEALPSQPIPVESALKRTGPQGPSALRQMGQLCEGEPLHQCAAVDFTHCDFALLLLDTLGLSGTENCTEAFALLDTIKVGPYNGWARSNPQNKLTPEDLEEIRCSVLWAFKDGLIQMSPSVVSASLRRFCEEFQVSLNAVETSGIVKSPPNKPDAAETGHQDGNNGVVSPPF